MARPKGIPGYLHHKASGRAFVRINGTDIYLGFYGTPESKAEYDRILKEWLANDRQIPVKSNQTVPVTVDRLCLLYLKHAKIYYRKDGVLTPEVNKIETACKLLHEHCGSIPAVEFTKQSLKAIREYYQSQGWKRKTVNERIGHIKRIFKWGANEGLFPASVYQELQMLEGLKKWRSSSPESEEVPPVPWEHVEKTMKFCSSTIADMIWVQFLAGMRPGEVCALKVGEVDTHGDVWVFDYKSHKTAHHGFSREIWFGPKAQAKLTPYLIFDEYYDPKRYLFSPRDTIATLNHEKRQNRKTKVQPSQISRAKKNPMLKPGDRYKVNSYRTAIQRATERYNKAEIKKAKEEGREPDLVPKWFPNQLRHLRATIIRSLYGLEASQVVLGHEKADVTQIYAERDRQKAIDIMREIG